MDSQLLRRYLDGVASESERSQCEDFLNDPDAVVELSEQSTQDSLLETLRISGQATEETDDPVGLQKHLESLVQKVERLAPRTNIGSEELKRILDPAESPDELGRIGRFRVLEFIAGGGMGLVFRAEDPDLDRAVCIKVMNPLLTSRGDAKQRFQREAKAAARLQHERIVTVFEVGEFRELPFLVMELLEGESLRQRLNRLSQLSPEHAERVVRQVAEGLRYAHQKGFLHRDIKPDNIWLTPDENIKLLDFGLARALDDSIDLTQSGAVVGTPRYMSPEQVQSESLNATSDLFSLGSVYCEMLTGKSPFERANVFSTLMSVANDHVTIPWDEVASTVPEKIRELVSDLLAKDPEQRPTSADAVIGRLAQVEHAATVDLLAVDDHQQTNNADFGGKGRLRAAVGGAAFSFLLLLCSVLVYQETDKGTLVIEADPSIEVKIKDGQVNVKDPMSGKSYAVRIGSQPLPSGVYQLELEDRDSGLTLSSQVVTIRRNEQQIVKIDLRSTDAGERKPMLRNPTQSLDPREDAVTDGRTILASIEPLDASETERSLGLRSRDSLSPAALVQQPPKLPNVRSWSLEPTRVASHRDLLRISMDGRRIAQSHDDGFVRILNDRFELVAMLPATDQVTNLAWSPEPNVLLVVCQGDKAREALLWRIKNQQGELLRRIPVEAEQVSWSPNGDRIAFASQGFVRHYDVRAAKMFAIAGTPIRGAIDPSAWSRDGQKFASTDGNSVKIWSLSDSAIYHVFPRMTRPQWLAGDDKIAVRRAAGVDQQMIEIWNVDELAREKAINIPSHWALDSIQLDQNGGTIAAVTNRGTLAYGIDGQTEIELVTSTDVENGALKPNKNVLENLSDVAISANGDHVLVRLYNLCALFERQDGSSVVRKSGWVDLGDRWLPAISGDIDQAYEAGTLSMVDREDGSKIHVNRWNLQTLKAEGTKRHVPNDGRIMRIFASISPNRGHALVSGKDGTPSLIELPSGKDIEVTGPPIFASDFEWTKNGRYGVASTMLTPSPRQLRGKRITVVDVQNATHRVLDSKIDRAESDNANIISHQIVRDRLWVLIRGYSSLERGQGYQYRIECYDLETLRREQSVEIGAYQKIDHFCVLRDRFVWFSTKSIPRSMLGNGPWTAHSMVRNAGVAEVIDGVSGLESAARVIPSHDESFLLFSGYDRSARSSYFILPTEALIDASSGVATKSFRWQRADARPAQRFDSSPPFVRWHSQKSQVAVILGKSIRIDDLDRSRNFQIHVGNDDYKQAVPTEFGWIVQTSDWLRGYDFDGNFLGTWLDTRRREPGEITSLPNRWVGSNGATVHLDESDDVCLIQLVGNQVITVKRSDKAWQDLSAKTLEALRAEPYPWTRSPQHESTK